MGRLPGGDGGHRHPGRPALLPVATLLLGKEAALFAYVLPFLISSVGGALLSVAFLTALDRTKALDQVETQLRGVTFPQRKA